MSYESDILDVIHAHNNDRYLGRPCREYKISPEELRDLLRLKHGHLRYNIVPVSLEKFLINMGFFNPYSDCRYDPNMFALTTYSNNYFLDLSLFDGAVGKDLKDKVVAQIKEWCEKDKWLARAFERAKERDYND